MRGRTVAIVVAAAAVSAGVVPVVDRFWRDARADEVIEQCGCGVSMPIPDVTVYTSFQGLRSPLKFDDAQLARIVPALPDVDHFDGLDLTGTSVTDAGVARLATVPQLRRLVVSGTPITTTGLMQLRGLPRLAQVVVAPGQITPADLRALAIAMPRVEVYVIPIEPDVWRSR